MKTINLSLALIILLGTIGYTQSNPKKIKPYTARIQLSNGEKVRGILYDAKEEAIILLDKNNVKISVPPSEVQWIKVRRKGRLGRGALIGGASGGLLAGLTVNWWDNEIDEAFGIDVPDNETVLPAALIGAASGAAIGGFIGSRSEKFQINGNPQSYLSRLTQLRYYTSKQ